MYDVMEFIHSVFLFRFKSPGFNQAIHIPVLQMGVEMKTVLVYLFGMSPMLGIIVLN